MTVGTRLALILCGIAAFATGLAVTLQDRALSADLREAAADRLQRAASVAGQLLEGHLEALEDRYRAVSLTPEFRANLDVDHSPTLNYYAERLAIQQGAALLLFSDLEGEVVGAAGAAQLARAATGRIASGAPEPCATDQPEAPARRWSTPRPAAGEPAGAQPLSFVHCAEGRNVGEAWLTELAGGHFAFVSIPLLSGDRRHGRILAAERVDERLLTRWSELSGARVHFAADESPASELVAVATTLGPMDLRVEHGLDAERRALRNARSKLLTAGALALAVAFAAALLAARSLVRPIREIQHATEPFGRGELGVRLRSTRPDEIGDVARAFDAMADRVEGSLAELRQSEAQLASAQRLAHLGSWSAGVANGKLHASREFRRIFDLERGDEPLDAAAVLARIHPGDRDRVAKALRRCRRDGTPFRLDHRSVPIRGTERVLHTQAKRSTASDGELHLEGTVQDITERKLVEEQVRFLAYHDSLTGLGNRRLFHDHLALSIQRSHSERDVVGLLLIDLDGFKLVNDTLGHSLGDQLLRSVAERVVEALRAGDAQPTALEETAPPGVARIDGDEFAVALAGISGPQDAGRLARRILHRLERPFDLEGHELTVSAAIGIATWPADGRDAETLLRNCDTAMVHAKEQGRNTYQFFSESMNAVVFKRLVLENKLRKAIERDELELQFQPRVDLRTGRVAAFEALARWRDPDLGMVSPSEFIPLAEETGLIVAIGDWVLEAAIGQIVKWESEGPRGLRLSVNLSGHQLRDNTFAGRVADQIARRGIDPRQLELEITETTLMAEESHVVEALEELRALGVGISLDDFGTGYSSLSHLRRLPLDTLKIDRSFVRLVDEEPDDASLLGAIVSMARVLRLCVVVEGVETRKQLDLLRELGCDEIQGHLMSPAVPAADVARTVDAIEQADWVKPRAEAD